MGTADAFRRRADCFGKGLRSFEGRAFGVGDPAEVYALKCAKMSAERLAFMAEKIEAIFDGAVFRPVGEIELKPNTTVEITIAVKNFVASPTQFRVRSKHLGVRQGVNYNKTSELREEVEGTSE